MYCLKIYDLVSLSEFFFVNSNMTFSYVLVLAIVFSKLQQKRTINSQKEK